MNMNSLIENKQLPNYIDSLQSQGEYWFLGVDVQKELMLSDGAIKAALWRLGKKNKVCRVRGDFYVIVPPEHRSAGCLPAQWFVDPLMSYLKLPYYVALLSAASLHGAAHQQVMMLQVMTSKPLRKIIVGNQQIQFHFKSEIEESWLDQNKTPMSYFKLSNPELTAIDLVRYANSFDQLQQVATVIYELVERLDSKQLAGLVSESAISVTSAQRLGYILDSIIHTDLDLSVLELAINAKKPRYIPLISGKTDGQHERSERWHVLIDGQLELDEI